MPSASTQTKTSPQKQRSGTLNRNKTRYAITIGVSVGHVYEFWRHFENLAKFMKDIRKISVLSPTRSKWEIQLKAGPEVSWEAEITEDIPNRKIAWSSVPGSEVAVSGEVQFEKAPMELGTVVSLSMDYNLPGGLLTEWTTFFSGQDPDTLAITNLKRLKALLETGEFPTTQGQPSGREGQTTELKH